jgi:uncharacterized metal-binding protein
MTMGTVIRIVVLGVIIVAIIALVTPVVTTIFNFIVSATNSEIIEMANLWFGAIPSDLKNIMAVGLSVLGVGLGLDLIFRQ